MGRKFADKCPTFDGDLSLRRVLAMGVDGLSLVGSSITGLHLEQNGYILYGPNLIGRVA